MLCRVEKRTSVSPSGSSVTSDSTAVGGFGRSSGTPSGQEKSVASTGGQALGEASAADGAALGVGAAEDPPDDEQPVTSTRPARSSGTARGITSPRYDAGPRRGRPRTAAGR